MKKIVFIFAFIISFAALAQTVNRGRERDVVYTALPEYYYMSWFERVVDPRAETSKDELRGLAKDIAQEIVPRVFKSRGNREIKLNSHFEAISAVKVGRWDLSGVQKIEKGEYIDIIIGIPYDDRLAEYLEYIFVPIAKDNLLIAINDRYAGFKYEDKSSIRSLHQKNWFAATIRDFPMGTYWDSFMDDIYGYNSDECLAVRLGQDAAEDKKVACHDVKVSLKRVEANIDDIMKKVISDKGFYYMGSMFALFDYISRNGFDKQGEGFKNRMGEGFYSQGLKNYENDGAIPLFVAVNKRSELLKNRSSSYDPIEELKKELQRLSTSGRLEQMRQKALNDWKNRLSK